MAIQWVRNFFSAIWRPSPQRQAMPYLSPIAVVENRSEYAFALKGKAIEDLLHYESQLLASTNALSFNVDGFCLPCATPVQFLVDAKAGGQIIGNTLRPNWRERLICSTCGMNNRQRLIAGLVKQNLQGASGRVVYFMEHVSPIYHWAVENFGQHKIYGSEYLGDQYTGGQIVDGIRHEDVENLSFSDNSIDLIVSNDVFEHIANPSKGFAECARVLKPNGVMLATIPFHADADVTVMRSKFEDGKLVNLLPQEFHGNPISAEGSLVFSDFGWDVLDMMRVAGFTDVAIQIYGSAALGHLGGGVLLFHAKC